ncbi:MAG: efflux transporter outer membrane subunit, partial [Candidatus Omnitrophica bacterium]|nr:efflux transporter outer membrane subunit [Candidatus Omnitrophota bacterium]
LQKLIQLALANNRDLRLAALNVERSRNLYGVQRAELMPAVSATGAGSRQHLPADLSMTGKEATSQQYSVNLGIVSWEIDLFGRLRGLKKKALEEYLATEQARRGAETALIGEVAGVYFALAADRENLKLVQATQASQEEVYGMIRKQYDNGVATEVDLSRSRTQVDVARGDIARYTQLVAQDQNALELLVGATIPDELLPSDLSSVTPPGDIATGMSSEVLLHRPDILAAEHQLKAAYAFIDIARTAFFPRISLTTTLGTASQELSGLFKPDSDTWIFAPQLSVPIFDARTWAAFRVSQATRDIALAQYEKAVQIAFREVADVLAVRGTVDQQVAAQESIVDSAQKVYELSDQRYKQGLDGYLGVLDAQRSLYSAQQGLTALRLARLTSRVRLFAVLGGE